MMESNDIASCTRWSLSPFFLFYPSADTREQHPTSMTCDTSSRSDDDDDDSNNNNPFPCRHHQAGVTRGPLPRLNKAPTSFLCALSPRDHHPSSHVAQRWTVESPEPAVQPTSNRERVRCTARQLAFVESHFGHTRELFLSAPVNKRSSASARDHGYRRFCHALVALQSSLCDRCSQRVDIDAARLKPIEPLKNGRTLTQQRPAVET